MPSQEILDILHQGTVIPAHPLALTAQRKLDEKRQRALTRYYADSGAGGIAVGVHTTQFAIRSPEHGLFRPVLELAAETACRWERKTGRRIVKVAGLCGPTAQAASEAEFARSTGYDIGLLSLAALKDADDPALIAHCRAVAEAMPLFGFYLQPSVGGRILGLDFWRKFAEIPNAVAIKMAPFNRYQTLDVLRAVAEAGRAGEIALYTGNDDNIVLDLLTEYRIPVEGKEASLRIVGGLLGHWAVWTQKAVELLKEARRIIGNDSPVSQEMLTRAIQVTDSNAAFFDPAHSFAGCIAGLHEVLRRQGLMQGLWCLDPEECLSPGQSAEIDRVYRAYPHLNDDAFVAERLEEWLA
ncbi:MAG: dihydrodipicolinate synthase family protein [Armatimonadetes bacterium]|nr:dihydrodipicolinate synthase family protein [Armatimonadota bacterium]